MLGEVVSAGGTVQTETLILMLLMAKFNFMSPLSNAFK